MNPAKKLAVRTVNFVNNHKVPITAVTSAAATAAVCLKAHRKIVVQFNEFLDEHNLKDEFYKIAE